MRHSYPLSRTLKAILVTSTVLLVMPGRGVAGDVLPLGPFRSVTLRNGGEVILRHSSSQRVTLLKGTADYTSATIVEGDQLVIDRCSGPCPKGYRLAVEILAPNIDDVMVMDGGTIQTRGNFPHQAELRVAVESGGTIDLRSMSVDRVTAAVREGGRILTKPQETLVAKVTHGGVVTYWGTHHVTSTVEDGGVVSRGAPADADKPLDKFGPASPVVPPVPPLPPTRVRGSS